MSDEGARRFGARWATPKGALEVWEPSLADANAVADRLAAFYNEPHNAALLTNTIVFTPQDVVQFLTDARSDGGLPLLLARDGELVGDCDLRNIERGVAELALLIGPRALQGKGLGVLFAVMVLAIGFDALGLSQVCVVIRPQNEASLRMFGKVGFVRDEGKAARAYAEEDDDVCLSIKRDDFFSRHARGIGEIERQGSRA